MEDTVLVQAISGATEKDLASSAAGRHYHAEQEHMANVTFQEECADSKRRETSFSSNY